MTPKIHSCGKSVLRAEPEFTASRKGKIPWVTGVILAGGASIRMGSNKALLPHKGGRFIESIYRELSEIFAEVIVVTDTPDQYHCLPCRKVPDLFQGMGALAGILLGRKVPGAEVIASFTFLAILITIIIQATSTRWLAGKLGLLLDE